MKTNLCELCTTIHDNFRGLRKFFGNRKLSDSDTPRAKRAKFGNQFLFFAPFARDIPRLSGARSAPYEILFFLTFAPLCDFAGDNSNFGCGVAALGLCGEYSFTGNPE